MHQQLTRCIVEARALGDPSRRVGTGRTISGVWLGLKAVSPTSLPPGLYAYWTGVKDVRVELVDARNVRLERDDLQVITAVRRPADCWIFARSAATARACCLSMVDTSRR